MVDSRNAATVHRRTFVQLVHQGALVRLDDVGVVTGDLHRHVSLARAPAQRASAQTGGKTSALSCEALVGLGQALLGMCWSLFGAIHENESIGCMEDKVNAKV